ncbi:ABC transporter ATP-binding protein [Parapedobacter sp. 10938]|uniref:ABC transporter ATP-binding protein n=1 Tax=Parapedobacter flavus TaxID=3110225 RepID=UPI002DB97763|nr:ABC transporter ATP-binding protein [Parapedobacter sp. 10938]MEC3878938.1 ABC transporter ATP-binding protein [Parapedobacter sp. 10938]
MEETQPIISITGLEKWYGSKHILKGIDLDIYPGQIIGYIGPNGAGKSTTVKILCGLIADFKGTVTVDGIDLRADALAVKAKIGYVPENAELYDVLTPLEYLDFVGKLYGMEALTIRSRAERLLASFGLGDRLHTRMDTFSKGMRQKVLLIAGIIHNPRIIMLDEPLAGLDANAVITVKEMISLLAKEGKTIFYCSHMMDVVEKISDRILLINDGAIVADGTFDSLKHEHGETLERVFSRLTGRADADNDAAQIISALDEQ